MFKIKNKKRLFAKRNGMTLIEVVVVIAIVGIMSAVSIVSYATSKRSAEMEAAAEELVAVLREAQNYSLTGKGINAICSDYRVTLNNSDSKYSLVTYNGVAPTSGVCSTFMKVYSFNNGVTISSSTGFISFAAPHGQITSTLPSVNGFYQATINKNGGIPYYVCVNNSGLIKKTLNSTCN